MKNILKLSTISSLAAAVIASCTPSYPEVDGNGIPQASELDVTVTVDQSTNFATFSVSNKEVVPLWIFGTEAIDGKANKTYAYAGNGVTLRIREEGDHSVEVKAYNKNGLSVGSQIVRFHMDNTYHDPFDPAPYVNALSGGSSKDWVWNSTKDDHFGSGPYGDVLNFSWTSPAGGMEGFLYDDVLTFDSEGNYTFTPGDGNAYANKASEYMTEFKEGNEDYLFPATVKTTGYHLENNWNAAGIEEVFLCFESGTILSYVPHKSIVENPRYQLLATKISEVNKKLSLMASVYTTDAPDGISWYYEFVPDGLEEEDNSFDDTAWDYEAAENLWPKATVNYDLWFSPQGWTGGLTAIYKSEDGNGITVTVPEGTGGEEWMGQVKFISDIETDNEKIYDFSITLLADEDMTVTVKLTGEPEETGDPHQFFYDGHVELEAGTPYVFRASSISQKESCSQLKLIVDLGRSPVGSTVTASKIIFQEHTSLDVWQNAAVSVEQWFSPQGWGGGINADIDLTAGNGVTVTIPEGTGGEEWMGQVKLISDIETSEEDTYNLRCTLVADEDMTVTLKLTGEPEGTGDPHVFFYDGKIQLEAGVPLVYSRKDLTQEEGSNSLKFILDVGRSPIGSTIELKDVCFMKQQ